MRLLVIQYAGDYLEAYRRLVNSGTEIYYGHRYVLEQLGRIGSTFGDTAILCCRSSQEYGVKLPLGVTVIGSRPDSDDRAITRLIGDYNPTHLAVLGPMPRIIRWGIATKRRILCIFADSFETNRVHRFLRYGRLSAILNSERVEWVANHGINACLSTAKLGVKRSKIIPWDWPHLRQPSDMPPKSWPAAGVRTLVFAGAVIAQKGIGDVITAVASLRNRGIAVELKVAGAGDLHGFKALAKKLKIESYVHFLGLIPNDTVLQLMRDAFTVVVPSRHRYPEGMPLTIYEALCARTPIVASDHPMFAGNLVHRVSAMIFRAGQPDEIAACVEELFADARLYAALSGAAQETWEGLQIPVKWGDLLYNWAGSHAEDQRWFFERRLESARYNAHINLRGPSK